MGVIFIYLEKSCIENSYFLLINWIHYLLLQETHFASSKEGKISVLTASSWRWWKGGGEMFHPEMWNPTRQLWKGEGAAAANGKLCWALGQNSVKQHYKNPVKTNELLILLSTVVPDLLQIQTGGPRPPVSCRRAGLSGCWDISCTSPLPVGLSCPVVPMLSPQLCHVCQCFSLLPPWDVVSVQEHH